MTEASHTAAPAADQVAGAAVVRVQKRLRHASAMTTLNTYGHMWPDADESSRAAVDAVLTARAEDSLRTENAR